MGVKYKKGIKILLITIVVSIFLIGCGSETKKDTQEKDVASFEKEMINNGYTKVDFVCDGIKGKVIDSNYNRILTNDGDIYFLSLDKKYSDDTNCKKVDTEIKFKKIFGNELVLSTDDKFYSVTYFDNNMEVKEFDRNENQGSDDVPSVYEYILSTYGSDTLSYTYNGNSYIIYKDNKVYYKLIRKDYDYENKKYKFTDRTDNELEINDTIIYMNNSFGGFFETETSFYRYEETNKDECNKYADVVCEYGLVKDDLLTKYKSHIQTVIDGRILDKNNNLYSTTGW